MTILQVRFLEMPANNMKAVTNANHASISCNLAIRPDAQCIGRRCKGLLGWEHVRQVGLGVAYFVKVKKPAAWDALLLKLLPWIAACSFWHAAEIQPWLNV
jgi:hypothetical protein